MQQRIASTAGSWSTTASRLQSARSRWLPSQDVAKLGPKTVALMQLTKGDSMEPLSIAHVLQDEPRNGLIHCQTVGTSKVSTCLAERNARATAPPESRRSQNSIATWYPNRLGVYDVCFCDNTTAASTVLQNTSNWSLPWSFLQMQHSQSPYLGAHAVDLQKWSVRQHDSLGRGNDTKKNWIVRYPNPIFPQTHVDKRN